MENYIAQRLAEIAKLLNIINEKLELLQQSILLSIRINGKLHGVDFKTSTGDIDESLLNKK
ncbi:MAG: hypothetical protein ONB31_14765 [candidate division KSB1 bacterium]|nr:hypothetical protein [candidate division KSB1 bacterium]MDZ7333614.1 hypothetical protein [candidate division KSB1 bacterium]MDZ7357800.1 hypothetical protein [candidate division KSB1 bacterium]MDZ7398728.1 hypothetical protein [candidate division KSB1 bacterium]